MEIKREHIPEKIIDLANDGLMLAADANSSNMEAIEGWFTSLDVTEEERVIMKSYCLAICGMLRRVNIKKAIDA